MPSEGARERFDNNEAAGASKQSEKGKKFVTKVKEVSLFIQFKIEWQIEQDQIGDRCINFQYIDF